MRTFLLFTLMALLLSACSTSAEFEGLYISSFETSAFIPSGQGCPGDASESYWLSAADPSFFERYNALASQTGSPLRGTVVRVRFIGRLSEPGSYGHLGAYPREITVEKLLEMTLDNSCPPM